MKNRNFVTALLFGAATVSLSAQAPSHFYSKSMEPSALADSVNTLTHTALFTLLGAILLAGVAFIWHAWKSCASLNQSQTNTRNHFLLFLICTAGLSAFGSSCNAAQRARSVDIRAAQATEIRTCPMNAHCCDRANTAFNSRSPYQGFSNWQGSTFCKFCGQRIYSGGH
jgi:hypothetical protein